jgi:hypothetical protein
VAAAFDLLAKQPSYLDEPAFDGADLGFRYSLGKNWRCGRRRRRPAARRRRRLGRRGRRSAGAHLDRRDHPLPGLAGVSGTRLFMGEDSGRPWFTELVSHGEALLRAPRGEVAGWLGVDYRVRWPMSTAPSRSIRRCGSTSSSASCSAT